MKEDIIKQLRDLKSKDKFPVEDWSERGLNPSPEDVIDKMNKEVNNFIDFAESLLTDDSAAKVNKIQFYIDDWDSFDYDTEETEYIVDKMCEVMRIVHVDCQDILI